MIEDTELLRRYAEERSEGAFTELVQRRLGLVYAVALRQTGGDAHRAEDVAQTVFTNLARRAASLAHQPVLAGWLYRSAQFAAIDAMRAERRRQAREQTAHTMNEILSENSSPADWDKLRSDLDQVLSELDAGDRDALVLRFFDDRPFNEIGAKLRVTESAARMRVERALHKMRAMLARRGVTSTTAALAVALTSQAGVAAPAALVASVSGAALAGAASGGAVAATVGFIKFMSTTKIITGAAIIALAVFAGYEATAVQKLTESVASLGQDRDAMGRRLQGMTDALARAKRENDDLQARNAAAIAASTSTAPPSNSTEPPRPGSIIIPRTAAMGLPNLDYSNPKIRDLVQQDLAIKMRAQFDRFFQSAHLSPEQQGKFIDILNARTQGFMDLAVSMTGIAASPESEATMKNVGQQILQDVNGNLKSLIGDAAFQQYQQADASLRFQPIVDQVAARLNDSPAPLTPDQADQLTAVLAQNRLGNLRGEPSPATSLNGTPLTIRDLANSKQLAAQQNIDWVPFVTDAVISQAASALPPAQVAALKQLQQQQAIQLKLAPSLLSSPSH